MKNEIHTYACGLPAIGNGRTKKPALTKMIRPVAGVILFFAIQASADSIGDFFAAVSRGDIKNVESLLQQGADVNMKDAEGRTALMKACHDGDTDMAGFLIEKGAHVNGAVLMRAISSSGKNGHRAVGIIRLLLDKGADANARSVDGRTALMNLIAVNGNTVTMQLMLDRGENKDAETRHGGGTPEGSSREGYLQSVRLLLERGADVNARTKDGYTALMLASSRGHEEVVQVLLAKGADINTRNNEGKTALRLATDRGNRAIAKVLSAAGARY